MLKLFIKEKRLERKLTQEELSKLSGVSKSYIGDLERNEKEPSITVLCKLSRALKVKIEDLFYYEE